MSLHFHRPQGRGRLTMVMCAAVLVVVAISATAVANVVRAPGRTDFTVADDGGSLPSERPDLRAARAPLSTEETGYALYLAGTDPQLTDATDVRGEPGAQPLYTDLPSVDEDESDHRRAVVMVYDYTADQAVRLLVDLTSGVVLSAESDPASRPPMVADEADVAMALALDTDEDLAFRGQFETEQGVPLLTADQVGYSAGVWTYDQTTIGGRECTKHRCARLLLRAPSGSYLDTTDFVVDLTAHAVIPLS